MENNQPLTEYQQQAQLVNSINQAIDQMVDIAELMKQAAEKNQSK